MEELKRRVSEALEKYMATLFVLPAGEEALALTSQLHSQVESLTTQYEGENMIIEMKAHPWLVSKVDANIRKIGRRMLEPNTSFNPQNSISQSR